MLVLVLSMAAVSSVIWARLSSIWRVLIATVFLNTDTLEFIILFRNELIGSFIVLLSLEFFSDNDVLGQVLGPQSVGALFQNLKYKGHN
jgi:hypothetical protein